MYRFLESMLPALITLRCRYDIFHGLLCCNSLGITQKHEVFITSTCAAFQIDPSILQQTLQQGNLLAQQLTGEPGLAPQNSSLQTSDSTVPASVVIQPISGLSLQPTVTSANLTIGPLSEQDSVLTTNSSGKSHSLLLILTAGVSVSCLRSYI